MNPLVRRFLVLIVLAALAAGCTSSNNNGGNGTDNGGASPPPQMSTSEARTLLATAASEMPDRFGMTMTLTANGTEMMTVKGAFDNGTGESYFEMKGNASAFGEEAGEAGAQYFEKGVAIYTTDQGSLYLANGTAFVFPPGESEDGFVPSPEEGPLSQFTDPLGTFADFDENTTVHNVTPIVHKGKPAVRLVVSTTHEGEAVNATVIVWTNPQRLARIETVLPAEEDGESPLANARAGIDFAYDNDVTVTIPASAKRALGLAYTSNANPFGGNDGPVVWTFQQSGGIALGEVEVHVKDTSAMQDSPESGMDFAGMPTKWSMKLSDKTKAEGGVTIAFDDKDGDGKVSANDTLTITGGGNEPPTAVLYDTVTKTYVVPGFGVALLVGALAALALVFRRK